jgi:2-dehydropantoate 2-reductase
VTLRVAIVGAGAVGGFIAMALASVGADVVIIDPLIAAERCDWSWAARHDGRIILPTRAPVLSRTYDALRAVEICLVAVKSAHTQRVADDLLAALPTDATVISLQNGLGNASVLRAALGDRVAAGIVAFNARIAHNGIRRQTSSGPVLLQRLSGAHRARQQALCALLREAGQPAALRGRFEGIVAGKLILNLNNGVCAATGMTIAGSLADHDARLCYALCIREAVAVMRAGGLSPRRVTLLPPAWLGVALRLPDFVIGRWAPRLGHIDPSARSSTLQDLERGIPTEIDELNGAIVSLARAAGCTAPANATVVRLVHEHERTVAGGARPNFLSPAQLLHEMDLAVRLAAEPTPPPLTHHRRTP